MANENIRSVRQAVTLQSKRFAQINGYTYRDTFRVCVCVCVYYCTVSKAALKRIRVNETEGWGQVCSISPAKKCFKKC